MVATATSQSKAIEFRDAPRNVPYLVTLKIFENQCSHESCIVVKLTHRKTGITVATHKIHDRADEFRVDIIGRFAGQCVEEVRTAWQDALKKTLSRQFTVDLTRVSGYDGDGRKLLRDMHQHGTQFAAGTPEALVLLQEISVATRRGPMLAPDRIDGKPPKGSRGPSSPGELSPGQTLSEQSLAGPIRPKANSR